MYLWLMRWFILFLSAWCCWSCEPECNTTYQRGGFSSQEQLWLPVDTPATIRYASASDTVTYNLTGVRNGWSYPEAQVNECGEVYFTTYTSLRYASASLAQQLVYEHNAYNGSRLQVTFGNWKFFTPLADSTGVISLFQSVDTSYKNVSFTQLDSLKVDQTVYRKVKVMEMFTSSAEAFRIYVAAGKGIVQYELTDGSQWKLVH